MRGTLHYTASRQLPFWRAPTAVILSVLHAKTFPSNRAAHLYGLDQRAIKRDVVLDGVAVDDIPQQYC